MSKSAADKLGDRIRKQGLSEEDLRLLQQFRLDYDKPMGFVEQILREGLGLDPTSRMKSVTTIVEKLSREKTRLSSMQDIAGVRIVDMTLEEQDALIKDICKEFTETKVDDRRAQPSFGYRAVHVIAVISGFPVEIQVRTYRQHLWAELFEKLADRWGRQIRYGGPPDDPDSPAGVGTRREFVETLIGGSEIFAIMETPLEVLQERLRTKLDLEEESVRDSIERAQELKMSLEKDEAELRLLFQNVLKGLED